MHFVTLCIPYVMHLFFMHSVRLPKIFELFSIMNISHSYLQIGAKFLQVYKYFHPYRQEIKQIFKCGPKIMKKVDEYAKNIFKYL
jgi:hypothetical protein